MGLQIDLTLLLKYGKALENDKLTYIEFFQTLALESLQDPSFIPCIEKALKYCDDIAVPKLHELRLTLTFQIIFIGFSTKDPIWIRNVSERTKILIGDLEGSDSENMQIQKLHNIYTTQMEHVETEAWLSKSSFISNHLIYSYSHW
jgi:hypothetical protein